MRWKLKLGSYAKRPKIILKSLKHNQWFGQFLVDPSDSLDMTTSKMSGSSQGWLHETLYQQKYPFKHKTVFLNTNGTNGSHFRVMHVLTISDLQDFEALIDHREEHPLANLLAAGFFKVLASWSSCPDFSTNGTFRDQIDPNKFKFNDTHVLYAMVFGTRIARTLIDIEDDIL